MTLNDIVNALKSAPECTTDLLEQVYRFCRAKGKKPDDLFSKLLPMQRSAWEAFAADKPFKASNGDLVDDLIDDTFYVVRNDQGTAHALYPIRSVEHGLLGQPMDYDALSNSSLTDVGLRLNNTLRARGEEPAFLEVKAVKQSLASYFMRRNSANKPPMSYAQPSDDCWALARRLVEPDASCAMPDWERFLAGFEDPEAYAGKVYAIVTNQDTSRQGLVVRSVGKTGKSCAMAAITSIYDNDEVAKAITGTHVSQSSRFLASNYKQAALIYSPDCNVRTFLLSEVVKLLTGSDKVQYEVKNGGYGEYKAKAKLIVHMNPIPRILSDEHSRSRILYLQQNPIEYEDVGTDEFTRRLTAQLPGFLAYGKAAFEARWRDNQIKLNEAAQKTFDSLVGGERQDYYEFLDGRYVFDPNGKLDGADFTKALNRLKLHQHDRDQWREWLVEEDGVTQERTARGKVVYHGIRRKTGAANDDLFDNAEMDDAA